jgi:hypothetical protein
MNEKEDECVQGISCRKLASFLVCTQQEVTFEDTNASMNQWSRNLLKMKCAVGTITSSVRTSTFLHCRPKRHQHDIYRSFSHNLELELELELEL